MLFKECELALALIKKAHVPNTYCSYNILYIQAPENAFFKLYF